MCGSGLPRVSRELRVPTFSSVHHEQAYWQNIYLATFGVFIEFLCLVWWCRQPVCGMLKDQVARTACLTGPPEKLLFVPNVGIQRSVVSRDGCERFVRTIEWGVVRGFVIAEGIQWVGEAQSPLCPLIDSF